MCLFLKLKDWLKEHLWPERSIYVIHLIYGPEGKQFSRVLIVEGNIRTRGKTKLTSFPRDHTLSALLYI